MSKVTITKTTFVDNRAGAGAGAGIYDGARSTVHLQDMTFIGNSGGNCEPKVSGC